VEQEERAGGHSSLIDRAIKTLIRTVPPALFRLAQVEVGESPVVPADTAVNLPEFRADQVFVVGEAGDPGRWALHLE
jgi:protein involved in polysaccharide export with SLBB domain